MVCHFWDTYPGTRKAGAGLVSLLAAGPLLSMARTFQNRQATLSFRRIWIVAKCPLGFKFAINSMHHYLGVSGGFLSHVNCRAAAAF
jgi:hypothetical protein